MQKTTMLTREQVIILTFLALTGNMVYTHTWISEDAGRASWLASFLGVLLVIPFAMWIFHLGKYLPQGTVFDILQKGVGRVMTAPFILLFTIINIVLAVVQLNLFTQMINVFFLQLTPSWVIMSVLVLMSTLFMLGGINTFGRLVEILAVVGLFNFFAAFIFAPKLFRIEHIIPIFDTSVIGFAKGTYFIAGGVAEGLLLLMIIICYINKPNEHHSWAIKGIILSALVIGAAIFIIIGIMSLELSKRIAYGGVNPAVIIQVGEFVQGLEVFIFGAYQFIAIGKITISIYIAWKAGQTLTNAKLPLIQLVIIAGLILYASIWLNSYNKAYFISVFLAKYILLPYTFAILLFATLSVLIIKHKAGSVSE